MEKGLGVEWNGNRRPLAVLGLLALFTIGILLTVMILVGGPALLVAWSAGGITVGSAIALWG